MSVFLYLIQFYLKIFIFFRLLIMSYALFKYSLLIFGLILIDFYKYWINDPSTPSIIDEFFDQWMTDSKLLAGIYDRHLYARTTSYWFKIFFSDLKYFTKNITTMHPYTYITMIMTMIRHLRILYMKRILLKNSKEKYECLIIITTILILLFFYSGSWL